MINLFNLNPIHKPLKEEILAAISSIYDSSEFVEGKRVARFEEEFAEYCGAKYCVAVNSGTSALHLALLCCGANKKKKISTVSSTFFATAEAISYTDAKIQFVDVSPLDSNIDPELITDSDIYLPVSLYGNPCNLTEINKKKKSDQFIIHDACQAHGTLHNGKKISSFSDVTCFSFYPSKNLGAIGEGGALVTDNKDIYDKAKRLKQHGQSEKYIHDEIGYNYRMDEIQAAALSIKLKYLDEWNRERDKVAKRYRCNLKDGMGKIAHLFPKSEDLAANHLFPIFIENRDEVSKKMQEQGVFTGKHYFIPIHLQKPFLQKKIKLKNTELLSRMVMTLPIYVGITNQEIDEVSEKLLNILK